MEKIEDYYDRGFKANQDGGFEEFSLWILENANTLTISELENLIDGLSNNTGINDIYHEQIQICLKAKNIKMGYV